MLAAAGGEEWCAWMGACAGNNAKVSECSAPAILNMSAGYNSLSEMGVDQPVAVGRSRKQLPRGPRGRFVTANGNQEGTSGGRMVPFSAALRDCYQRFIATNGYQEVTTVGSLVHSSRPALDSCWPIVATNDEEENIGEVAYDSILNLESPDRTTLLRIMMGDKYNTDKVSEQFQNVARLQAPDFATLLTVMNNAGYGEAADDGHYDVDRVMTKLEGW
ncbi:hypothetical protein BAE44_0002667 [Dichanthelium oligosanthes]|uniref:Uncharacterized protein n=1 Tax=Dichanthelium oligosanthes TaxID=888268 RepID=A0A1E5WG38_9POAL|nr:hypothetical protein BAE44_0002667 [Dichanthelium oligosanthes]